MKKFILSALFSGVISLGFIHPVQAKTNKINYLQTIGSCALAYTATRLIKMGYKSGKLANECFKSTEKVTGATHISGKKIVGPEVMFVLLWNIAVPATMLITSAGFATVSAACFAGGIGTAIGAYALMPSEENKALLLLIPASQLIYKKA